MGRIEPTLWAKIEVAILSDPGGRGISRLVQHGDLERGARSLISGSLIWIASGFYIPSAGQAENDGPPGARAIGNALKSLGKQVLYVTDEHCQPVFREAGLAPLWIHGEESRSAAPDRLVSIERSGRAIDGKYYSMRGRDLTAYTAPLDDLFLHAKAHGISTIGIGDGGNEIGMGNVRGRVAKDVPFGETIGCVVPVDHLIVAGVSNWGAYALVAGLSLLAGRDLLPSADEEYDFLQRLLAAGAVDGVSERKEETIDGLSWDVHQTMLVQVQSLLQEALTAGRR